MVGSTSLQIAAAVLAVTFQTDDDARSTTYFSNPLLVFEQAGLDGNFLSQVIDLSASADEKDRSRLGELYRSVPNDVEGAMVFKARTEAAETAVAQFVRSAEMEPVVALRSSHWERRGFRTETVASGEDEVEIQTYRSRAGISAGASGLIEELFATERILNSNGLVYFGHNAELSSVLRELEPVAQSNPGVPSVNLRVDPEAMPDAYRRSLAQMFSAHQLTLAQPRDSDSASTAEVRRPLHQLQIGIVNAALNDVRGLSATMTVEPDSLVWNGVAKIAFDRQSDSYRFLQSRNRRASKVPQQASDDSIAFLYLSVAAGTDEKSTEGAVSSLVHYMVSGWKPEAAEISRQLAETLITDNRVELSADLRQFATGEIYLSSVIYTSETETAEETAAEFMSRLGATLLPSAEGRLWDLGNASLFAALQSDGDNTLFLTIGGRNAESACAMVADSAQATNRQPVWIRCVVDPKVYADCAGQGCSFGSHPLDIITAERIFVGGLRSAFQFPFAVTTDPLFRADEYSELLSDTPARSQLSVYSRDDQLTAELRIEHGTTAFAAKLYKEMMQRIRRPRRP